MKKFVLISILAVATLVATHDTIGLDDDDKPKTVKEQYDYPVPPASERNLFYIQRSPNANLIQYEINLTENGKIDEKEPIDVFWLRYNSHGGRRELKWYERKLAYGVKTSKLDERTWEVNLVSYKKRKLYVVMNDDGTYQANMEINGKISKFSSVFVDVLENTFFPTIGSIEIFGEDLETGDEVYERFVP